MVALDGGRPQVMNLKDLLTTFVAFREEVVSRRTKFRLNKARDRTHVLVGLAIAVANIDEVIRTIRASKDANEAREALMARDWPAADVAALIELIDDPRHKVVGRRHLPALRRAGARDPRPAPAAPHGAWAATRSRTSSTSSPPKSPTTSTSCARARASRPSSRTSLREVKKDFATPRRTVIIDQEGEMEDEDLIQREDMVVTVSHAGYVKRVPLSTYRAQRRGGKGRAGMQTRDEDFVTRLFVANTHTPVLFFSSRGPRLQGEGLAAAAGRAAGARQGADQHPAAGAGRGHHHHHAAARGREDLGELDVMFATTRGTVRRNKLSDFVDVRRSGIIAMKLDEGEGIVDVQICTENDDVLLTAAGGQCIRFAVPEVRVFAGRTSMGVRGINLEEDDKAHLAVDPAPCRGDRRRARRFPQAVERDPARRNRRGSRAGRCGRGSRGGRCRRRASLRALLRSSDAEQFVLTVSENGMGKRSSSYEYRTTGRGGKGIVAMSITPKTGNLVASFPVEDTDQIMLVTDKGQLIRTQVDGIRIAGRSTQGVIVFDTADDERVVSVERLSRRGRGERGRIDPEKAGPGLDPRCEAVFGQDHAWSNMSIELYLVFVLATALLIATPGPNVALIVGTSLTHGARTGLIAMAGVNLGVMVQLVVVAAGLSWIVELFAKQLRRYPLRRRGVSPVPRHSDAVEVARRSGGRAVAPLSANRAFARGLAVAFANPKTLIFQAAFLPQFLTSGEGRQAQLWLLAATFWIVTVIGDAIWVLCAARLRAAVSGRAQLIADRVSGAILIAGAGVLLAMSRR